MKRFVYALLFAGLFAQQTHPYAIVHGQNSAIGKVDIYIQKDRDSFARYLKAVKAPDMVISIAEKVAAVGVLAGGALAVPTEGASVAVAGAVAGGVAGAKAFNMFMKEVGLRDAFFRKLAGIWAMHLNVKSNNQGRGAEWNWASIKDQYGVPRGGKLYFVITGTADTKIPFYPYEGEIASDGLFGFEVQKVIDPNTKEEMYKVVPSSRAMSEYKPA